MLGKLGPRGGSCWRHHQGSYLAQGLADLLVSVVTPHSGSRLQVLPEGSLRIQPVLAQDAGHYFCLASNSAGSDRQGRDLQVFGRWTGKVCSLRSASALCLDQVLLSLWVILATRSQQQWSPDVFDHKAH